MAFPNALSLNAVFPHTIIYVPNNFGDIIHWLSFLVIKMNHILLNNIQSGFQAGCGDIHQGNELIHWGRVTHICVGNLTIIGPDNGLSPRRRQAILWTNAGVLLIKPIRINFSEIPIEIHTFSFKEMHLKMWSGKWRPFCLGLNVLNCWLESYTWFVSIFSAFQWFHITDISRRSNG